jgi:ornithine lipid ester-linked acyl 2-hydroxylase
VLIFDDPCEHEALNETGHPRVVLFVDFVKPLRFPASVLNWALLRLAVFTPYLREGNDTLRRWEPRFQDAANGASVVARGSECRGPDPAEHRLSEPQI